MRFFSKEKIDLKQKAEEEIARLNANHDFFVQRSKTSQNHHTGIHSLKKAGGGEQFWQYKDYEPEDERRAIDWRQSARTDSVLVRQKEKQSIQDVRIWCANSPRMNFSSQDKILSKKEAAQTLALSLALLSIKEHNNTGFIGAPFPPGRHEKTLGPFSDFLQTGNAVDFQDLPKQKIKSQSLVFLISDFLEDPGDIENIIVQLSSLSISLFLIQVLDRAELELPYHGNILFDDMASGTYKMEDVDEIRSAYIEKITQHNQNLENLCQKQGAAYIFHQTDQKISETLFSIQSFIRGATQGATQDVLRQG